MTTANLNPNLTRIHGLDSGRLQEILMQADERIDQLMKVKEAVTTIQTFLGNPAPSPEPVEARPQSQPQPATQSEPHQPTSTPRQRTMSPEAKKKISASMRKRWAGKKPTAAKSTKGKAKKAAARGGRPLSDAIKKKISAKQKARWAGIRAAQQAQQPSQPQQEQTPAPVTAPEATAA